MAEVIHWEQDMHLLDTAIKNIMERGERVPDIDRRRRIRKVMLHVAKDIRKVRAELYDNHVEEIRGLSQATGTRRGLRSRVEKGKFR